MSFTSHCTEGISTVKGFPSLNVLEGQQPIACYGRTVELVAVLPFLQDLLCRNLVLVTTEICYLLEGSHSVHLWGQNKYELNTVVRLQLKTQS